MPKKNRRSLLKPVNTPHHSLSPSNHHHGGARRTPGSEGEPLSVNDLISHLRRTQIPSSSEQNPQSPGSSRSFVSRRSVHPSLRNLLELPETPPPRPRLNARYGAIGRRPLRPTPGPPPPESWVSGDTSESGSVRDDTATSFRKVTYRLERLPGAVFPGKKDLMHVVLKAMAFNWDWHLKYDGPFLSQLPSHIKGVLLSYIAVYARNPPFGHHMKGLKPLFLSETHNQGTKEDDFPYHTGCVDIDAETRRLDLSCALGHWTNFEQLKSELVLPTKLIEPEVVPASWDEELNESSTTAIPRSLDLRLRFKNLRYLSLAHPNSQHASWNSLLQLLEHLSVITHLSLAHWPVPTRTFNASSGQSRGAQRLPRGLPHSHGGTDIYSALENNWAESAGILRQLSRYTYCLKWLDLEGCEWLPALVWTGTDPDGQRYRLGDCGPEWNRSWRDIEWIALGPGWECPDDLDANETLATNPGRSLASSVHAPTENPNVLPWDVEHERSLYRYKKARQQWCAAVIRAHRVHRLILEIRRHGRGKWMHAFAAQGIPLPDLTETEEMLSKES